MSPHPHQQWGGSHQHATHSITSSPAPHPLTHRQDHGKGEGAAAAKPWLYRTYSYGPAPAPISKASPLALADAIQGGTSERSAAVRPSPTGEVSFKTSVAGLQDCIPTPVGAVALAVVPAGQQAPPSGRSQAASMRRSLEAHAAALAASLKVLRQATARLNAEKAGEQREVTQAAPHSVDQGLKSATASTGPLPAGRCVTAEEEEEEEERMEDMEGMEERSSGLPGSSSSCIGHLTLHMSEVNWGEASVGAANQLQ